MAGAITIVVVLLIFPVLVLLSGADRIGDPRPVARGRRRAAQRRQRAARTAGLTPPRRVPARRRDAGAHRGHRPLRRRAGRPRSAPARRSATAGGAAGGGRDDHHRPRHRRHRGAADLRRGARPGVHLRRPPPLPVVRAGGADQRVDPVRPRRRCVEHLRRLVAGGRRRDPRRERGAGLDRRARRAARRGRRRVRRRRHRRQPQRPARRPLGLAPARRRPPRPHAGADAGVGRGPLLGRPGGAGDGRRRRGRPGRRLRPDDRRRAAGRPSTASIPPTAPACSPSSSRAARPTPG